MLLLQHTPRFLLEDATELAGRLYGLQAVAHPLPSERDQNFLLETPVGERFVLKIANALEERPLLEAQHEALNHLSGLSLCPRVIPSVAGQEIVEFEPPSGSKHFVRLLNYLPGTPLAKVPQPSPALLFDLGRKIALVDRTLANFDHPAIHRDFHWDLANGLRVLRQYTPLIEDENLRALIAGFAIDFEQNVTPLLPDLRQSAIHNDANDYNVIVSEHDDGQNVVGLIDFGDLVHSYTVGDLAVATAYAMLDKPDPLAVAAEIVKGYTAVYSLTDAELRALFGLVLMRLCMSVCHAAQQQRQRPDDKYLSISQASIRELLPRMLAFDRDEVTVAFRRACGFSPVRVEPESPQQAGSLLSDSQPATGEDFPQSGESKITKAETFAARRRLLGANLSLAYNDPIKIVRGSMQYLYDEQGRRYLDAYNNVPHVGHCHPRVVKAGQDQMAILNTNTRYLHDLVNSYAERLAATLPEPLNVCFFVNSGSEANELAIRLARAHTGGLDLIVLDDAYHGNTNTLIDISPYKHNGPGGEGAPSWVHTAPIPDTYRGEYQRDDPKAGAKYAQQVVEIIKGLGDTKLAGFIAESWPSVAGQMALPQDYLSLVYEAVRASRGVCIADEVQTAYGRLGEWFWGFEAYDVVPDIVVLGKPIGNGHPLGAVVTTAEIAASFANGMEFFSTFGGNTVSCAIGLAVLDVVLAEKLQAHALKVGELLLHGLRDLMERYSLIGDVRGSGLFIGVELVRDRATLEPATEEAARLVNRMREQGILLGTDGPSHNVIKIRPPMPFSLDDADLLIETMGGILAKDYGDERKPS
jgi:4-aminobutyrate aminotransferase-like enzyme/Ser/Thr protein kinase RdoA (MazF antagonist)